MAIRGPKVAYATADGFAVERESSGAPIWRTHGIVLAAVCVVLRRGDHPSSGNKRNAHSDRKCFAELPQKVSPIMRYEFRLPFRFRRPFDLRRPFKFRRHPFFSFPSLVATVLGRWASVLTSFRCLRRLDKFSKVVERPGNALCEHDEIPIDDIGTRGRDVLEASRHFVIYLKDDAYARRQPTWPIGCPGHDHKQRKTPDVIDLIKVSGKLLARDTAFFHEEKYRPRVEQIRRGQLSTTMSAV